MIKIDLQAHERLTALEREAIAKQATLEAELAQVRHERDQLAEARRQVVEEVSVGLNLSNGYMVKTQDYFLTLGRLYYKK